MRMWYDSLRRIPLIGFFLQMGEWLGHAEGASPSLMVASGEAPSEVYGHGGPGVSLGDGQTKAEEVLSQCGRGDTLFRRMPPYVT